MRDFIAALSILSVTDDTVEEPSGTAKFLVTVIPWLLLAIVLFFIFRHQNKAQVKAQTQAEKLIQDEKEHRARLIDLLRQINEKLDRLSDRHE